METCDITGEMRNEVCVREGAGVETCYDYVTTKEKRNLDEKTRDGRCLDTKLLKGKLENEVRSVLSFSSL